MEIRVLQYFLAIAREESISGAANFLHITQPTLSRQMKDLEEELGKPLFIRGNRKITLTEDGMLLRKRAEEIVSLVEKTEIEMLTSGTNITGDIYIGSGETEGMHIIAKLIKHVQEEQPNIRFNLYSGNGEDVGNRIDNGLLDFGLLVSPRNISKYDYLRLPYTDDWGLLMRKDDPLAALEYITAKDLENIPLICSKQALENNDITNWIGQNVNLNIMTTYNLIFNAAIMVEEGCGYALTLDRLVNTECNSDLCFKPLYPQLKAELIIVWKKYQVFSKASEYFLQQLLTELNKTEGQ